jgi:hypothetical protein
VLTKTLFFFEVVPMISRTYLMKFVRLAQSDLSYNETGKSEFHKMGKKVLLEVADRLRLSRGEFQVRSNLGGIAVSGEVTLHADWVYIQLSQGDMFMFRSCVGQADYCGGLNRWMRWDALLDLESACREFRSVRAVA